jgi:osmotically inducible protein OsmC
LAEIKNQNLNNKIMKRSATANWKGSGKEGSGTMTTQSGLLNTDQYSYRTRFEDGIGTNPEELIAAAHAGCFSMKLSFVLGAAGFTPTSIDTKCSITLESGAITESHLVVTAVVPGIDNAKFQECAAEAKENCPISKSLNTNINIVMEATLLGEA